MLHHGPQICPACKDPLAGQEEMPGQINKKGYDLLIVCTSCGHEWHEQDTRPQHYPELLDNKAR